MKKILLFMALTCGITAQAQEADYQPLVREGVVWHYSRVYGDMPAEEDCTMFFDGDSVVNNVVYKKCIKVSANGNRHVAALMRERDRVVYSIGGSSVTERQGEYDGEIILYNFQEPSSMFLPYYEGYGFEQTTVLINGVPCSSYSYGDNNTIIEGIGIDGSGVLSDLWFVVFTSTHYQYTGLSYVEKDGKVIYKGTAYEESADYQPLVREGVRWINHSSIGGDDYFSEATPYVLEFHGDTLISLSGYPIEYKKCYRYDIAQKGCVDFNELSPVAFCREIDGIVCMIDPNWPEREFIRYDFSFEGIVMLTNEEGHNESYDFEEFVDIQGKACRVYKGNLGLIVESVGLVSPNMGDMVHPKWYQVVGFDNYYGLDYMEDADGNIIYKSPFCSGNSAIGVVAADPRTQNADARWYDLMGHPFDCEPAQPGIYIHRGSKVVR